MNMKLKLGKWLLNLEINDLKGKILTRFGLSLSKKQWIEDFEEEIYVIKNEITYYTQKTNNTAKILSFQILDFSKDIIFKKNTKDSNTDIRQAA